MTASAPVPDEGELQLGSARLPAGSRLRSEGGEGEPVAWITEAPVLGPGPVWSALSALAPGVLEAAVGSFRASRIAVVPADRPADVLPVLGWRPGNWNCDFFPVPGPVGFAAVLRSWEERFGARLFAMTHDEAYLLVERQPVRTTAAAIIDAPVWYFWWD